VIIRGRSFQIGGYFFATIASAAASFFSVPLLTRLLGTEQFGRWSLLEPLQLLLSQIVLLGINYGIVKQINFDKSLPFATFISLLKCSQPLLILISIITFFALPQLGFSRQESGWFALLVYSEAVFMLTLALYRAADTVSGYATGSIVRVLLFLLALVLSVTGGWYLTTDILGVLTWRLVSTIVAIASSLYLIKIMNKEHSYFHLDNGSGSWQLYSDAVRYGWPMLVTGLLTMVIEFADRYILKAYFDYTTLAYYVVYLKIAAFLNPLIIAPISLWWPTERFKRRQTADGGMLFFRQVALIVLTILLLVGGALWLISPWLITWFAPGAPQQPAVILLLILSVVFVGMGAPLNIGLLDSGKTHLNIYGVLGGAVIHLVLCFALIPRYGLIGASLSTALSYLAYTVLLNLLSQRQYAVPFAYLQMLFLMVISLSELSAIYLFLGHGGFFSCVVTTLVYLLVFSLSAAVFLWYTKTSFPLILKKKPASPYAN
jgi:O-antigen/teichoic acid export membrane protein